ncbi:hypothetical protein [Rivularia sp. UHCC 0363]|uniref:hypothetical protein n=1 Tax=Rivularia sp. UHCC 0363 TaxID=3110244 RepID=UPI002B1F4D58|nr:hypothetical protein [Rivularia sp. UHCC 0363]MEA5597274.1 hypothetical protein [Rivularia sp. UHCC 0363]
MAVTRKSNLRGEKRWLGRSSNAQDNFRGYKTNEHTSPLSKPTPGFLDRPRRSSMVSNTSPIRPQRIDSHPPLDVKSVERKNRISNRKAIPLMPDGSKVPVWLMRWNSFHRHTSVASFLLVSATLIVYGWTVYSQHLWGRSYEKLQDLQRDERQLTKHDETLKNQMAQEGEKPHSGLSSPTPANTIFLEETAPARSQSVDKDSEETEPQPSNAVGY